MTKFLSKLKSLIPSKRKIIQLYFALLYNANLKGFKAGRIYQGQSKGLCLPGLNCYSCPGAVAACPLGSLQGAISSGKSTFYYVGGILVLLGVLFGRLICGFACPFGWFQELLYKIKTPKIKKGPVTRVLSYLKYVILVVFVVVIPLMYAFKDVPLPGFCKYICPAGTLGGGVSLLANKVNDSYFSMLGPIFTWKFCLLVAFVLGSVFMFRFFCRFFCPLGAIYGFFNRFSIFGIKLQRDKCVDCNKCVSHCKMDIKHVGDHECISCGECIGLCPTKAISWKGSSFVLHPNEVGVEVRADSKRSRTVKIVAAVVMVAVLAGALYYYNFGEQKVKNDNTHSGIFTSSTSAEENKPPVGSQVGNSCVGASLKTFNKNGITGDTVNPADTGKVTVVNFWGTWCGPCVAELPYFDKIATEYKDSVTVVAVHSAMGFEEGPGYVGEHYATTDIVFAKDEAGAGGDTINGAFYSALGGRGSYPYTVVLDEEGIIRYIEVASVDYDTLNGYVEALLD